MIYALDEALEILSNDKWNNTHYNFGFFCSRHSLIYLDEAMYVLLNEKWNQEHHNNHAKFYGFLSSGLGASKDRFVGLAVSVCPYVEKI